MSVLQPLTYEASPTQAGRDRSYPHVFYGNSAQETGEALADEKYKPADFYAGLRYRPLVSKSWFCFARPWFNKGATAIGKTSGSRSEIKEDCARQTRG